MFPTGSWAWGTFEERMDGGYPIRMLGDSVLPYSVPAAPLPDWWFGTQGQFEEGFHRNMSEDPDGLPNYPSTRKLNAVLPSMLALKTSMTAPFRFTQSPQLLGAPELSLDEAVWPFDEQTSQPTWIPAPAIEVLRTYSERYLANETKLIVMIPEREVMNAIGQPSDTSSWSVPPDNSDGLDAIAELVRACLTPTDETTPLGTPGLGLSAQLIGWYLIDEPDLPYRRRWATPGRLAKLRGLIKEAEHETRELWDDAYKFLPSIAEKKKRLRPIIITVTIMTFLGDLSGVDFRKYRTATYSAPVLGNFTGVAEIFGFDWYAYMRSQEHINLDYPKPACANPPKVDTEIYTLLDPVRSIRAFADIRQRLNGTLTPADPNYRGVFVWNQTDGWPFRVAGDPVTPDRSPANIKTEDIDGCRAAAYRRTKRFSSMRDLQYYNWDALTEGGEGTVGFSQFNAPDRKLRDEFSQVAAEMEFFRGLRYDLIDRSNLIVSRSLGHGTPGAGDMRDHRPPFIAYFDYLNQPESALGLDNRWLIIINRHYLRLTGLLRFEPLVTAGGDRGFRLQRVNFLSKV